jgi:hypothetical protein
MSKGVFNSLAISAGGSRLYQAAGSTDADGQPNGGNAPLL